MDIVYSLGPSSKTDNFELRMSLRSLEKFGKNIGKVIVVGYPPSDVLSEKVYQVRRERIDRKDKHRNILDAIFHVIDIGLVEGEFIYSSDDHFLNQEADFDNYPYFYKRKQMRNFDEFLLKRSINDFGIYAKSLVDTRTVLESNGYGFIEYSGHVNTHMNTADVQEVKRLSNIRPKWGWCYEPTCLFMNVRDKRSPVEKTFRKDLKVQSINDLENIVDGVKKCDAFSVGDGVYDDMCHFKMLMKQLYPNKCAYEK